MRINIRVALHNSRYFFSHPLEVCSRSGSDIYGPLLERYQFVQEHCQVYSISVMYEVLQVSRSGYYAWHERPSSKRSMQNERLVAQIESIYQQSRQTYGSPRIHDKLQDQGVICGENRVSRLMREHGIAAEKKRKFVRTTDRRPGDSNHQLPIAPNRLNQQFEVDRPNAVWTADITARRPPISGPNRDGFI